MSTTLEHDIEALATEVRSLRDERRVVDALYRFAAGQDLKRPELFLSAFAEDAILDFTQPARRFGAVVPPMRSRAAIGGILATLEPLDTTHTVNNPRVVVEGDRASLTALVEAQHVLRADPRRRLLLGNVYQVWLRREGEAWVIESMAIRNVWSEGDPEVLFGAGVTGGRADSGDPSLRSG